MRVGMDKNRLSVRDMAFIAAMSAVIAVCAWITIPLAVPFTLQIFGVFMALRLFGGKKGTLSILVYIALGAVGLPVFSGFQGGIGVLAGPTGGYIAGFLLMGALYWALEKYLRGPILPEAVLLVGLIVCYTFGTAWFCTVMNGRGREVTFFSGLGTCVLPFILPDLAKLFLSRLAAGQLKRALRIKSAAH